MKEVAMVSGKPPRRSKSPDEPVTIDLKAEEKSAPASDDTVVTVADEPPGEGDHPVSLTLSNDDAPASQGGVSGETETPPGSPEETSSAGSIHPDHAETAPPAGSFQPAQPAGDKAAPSPARSAPATSTLVASAILGGLVALALAGSMQYAGVLPTPGPGADMPVKAAASIEDMEALKAEVARLAATPTPTANTPDPALAERLAALETTVASNAGQQTASIDTAALDEMRTQLTAANDAIAALKSEIDSNRQALTESSTRLADAERRLDEPRNDVEMARAIALAGLKTAIDRGGPFLSELDALKSTAPEDPAVTALTATATAGVPSRADFVRDFPATADAILAAINAPAEGEGWTDRLMSSARSLVKVRPIGNVEGDTPEAIVARIENKLQNGDLKGAHIEWQALPEAGKSASQDFATRLGARIEAEEVVAKALARTVAGNEG